jgi:two-component system, sensor histidine kinase
VTEVPAVRGDDERVLLLAPTRRDAQVTCELLGRHDVCCVPCLTLRALIDELPAGVSAIIFTDAALSAPTIGQLAAALALQPPWSDVPVLVLGDGRKRSMAATAALNEFTNVTLLDRPTSSQSLVSALLAALRARRRQYQTRDQLEALQQAQQELQLADRRKNEFIATLAHELRNPLAPIRTGLQVMSMVPGDHPQALKVRQMMERQVGVLVRMIDDLLDVARISSGKVVLQREKMDLRSAVAMAIEASQPLIDGAAHRLVTRLPTEPVWVHADPARLAQAIGNLLNNAAKYTANGGRIEIGISAQAGEAVVRIIDNGAGISAEMLPELFKMFTQDQHTLGRAQGGLGIGLSLVQRLLELHGGSASAHSDGPGHGSTFTLRLPTLAADAGADVAVPAQPAASPKATGEALALRILVVDDNADAADALVLLLQAAGHVTRTAYDGLQALREAAQFRPEVVVCDIGLPGLDGHGVAARLRADPAAADALLIAATGWGAEDDRRKTLAAGFDLHLTKPLDTRALLDALARRSSARRPLH